MLREIVNSYLDTAEYIKDFGPGESLILVSPLRKLGLESYSPLNFLYDNLLILSNKRILIKDIVSGEKYFYSFSEFDLEIVNYRNLFMKPNNDKLSVNPSFDPYLLMKTKDAVHKFWIMHTGTSEIPAGFSSDNRYYALYLIVTALKQDRPMDIPDYLQIYNYAFKESYIYTIFPLLLMLMSPPFFIFVSGFSISGILIGLSISVISFLFVLLRKKRHDSSLRKMVEKTFNV